MSWISIPLSGFFSLFFTSAISWSISVFFIFTVSLLTFKSKIVLTLKSNSTNSSLIFSIDFVKRFCISSISSNMLCNLRTFSFNENNFWLPLSLWFDSSFIFSKTASYISCFSFGSSGFSIFLGFIDIWASNWVFASFNRASCFILYDDKSFVSLSIISLLTFVKSLIKNPMFSSVDLVYLSINSSKPLQFSLSISVNLEKITLFISSEKRLNSVSVQISSKYCCGIHWHRSTLFTSGISERFFLVVSPLFSHINDASKLDANLFFKNFPLFKKANFS